MEGKIMTSNIKLVKIFLIVLSAMNMYTITSFSQESSDINHKSVGMAYSMFGGSSFDFSALNSRLKSGGYADIPENVFTFGGGCHWIYPNRLIIGGEFHMHLGDEQTSGDYMNSLNAGFGFFNVGYAIYSKRQLRMYPLLGIGGGWMNFRIREKSASLSFDDILDNPERGVNLLTGGLLLNAAIGMDYMLVLGEDEKGKGGLVFGVRAGYTVSPNKNGWVMNDIDLSGSPKLGLTGPYIRFILFGGGYEAQ